MSVRHIRGRDDWYVITADRDEDSGRPPWLHRGVWLHGPNLVAHAEWNLLAKRGFGVGFQFGRNGGESDLGLDLYVGRLASVWLRLGSRWTRWARVRQDKDPKHWYYARHTGVRLFPHDGCILSWEFDALDGMWRRSDPKWRRWSLTTTAILGRQTVDREEGESGVARIPLPEGVYDGIYKVQTITRRYERWPGRLLDLLCGPQRWKSVAVSVDGGIPIQGKGENSYDCGMDGLFSISGGFATVEDAVAGAVKSVLRDRKRYGGPHNLPRPMTVSEAEKSA